MLTFSGAIELSEMMAAGAESDELVEAEDLHPGIADFRLAEPLQLTLEEVHQATRSWVAPASSTGTRSRSGS